MRKNLYIRILNLVESSNLLNPCLTIVERNAPLSSSVEKTIIEDNSQIVDWWIKGRGANNMVALRFLRFCLSFYWSYILILRFSVL